MKNISKFLFVFLFLILIIFSGNCKENETEEGEQVTEGWTITGTWNVSIVFKNNSTVEWTVTFTGDNASGTCRDSQGNTGIYQSGGTVVNWTRNVSGAGIIQYYLGIIDNENEMSGSFIGTDSGSGTWSASR